MVFFVFICIFSFLLNIYYLFNNTTIMEKGCFRVMGTWVQIPTLLLTRHGTLGKCFSEPEFLHL